LIDQFRKWKGELYVPSYTHNAIKWNQKNPFRSNPNAIVSPWHIIKDKSTKNDKKTTMKDITINFVTAKGTIPITNTNKCKNNEDSNGNMHKNLKTVSFDENKSSVELNSKRKSNENYENPIKKLKLSTEIDTLSESPVGLIWDEEIIVVHMTHYL
jgi:hypothetical protein